MNQKIKLHKKVKTDHDKVALYADESEYCELYDNYNPDSVDQVINVVGEVDYGSFNWDLAIWYWENYRDQFYINLLVGCFNT